MQAVSCLREGEYCRLIRVSVIIVGYVRFRLKFIYFLLFLFYFILFATQ